MNSRFSFVSTSDVSCFNWGVDGMRHFLCTSRRKLSHTLLQLSRPFINEHIQRTAGWRLSLHCVCCQCYRQRHTNKPHTAGVKLHLLTHTGGFLGGKTEQACRCTTNNRALSLSKWVKPEPPQCGECDTARGCNTVKWIQTANNTLFLQCVQFKGRSICGLRGGHLPKHACIR